MSFNVTRKARNAIASSLLLTGAVFLVLAFASEVFALLLLSGFCLLAAIAFFKERLANVSIMLCVIFLCLLIGESSAMVINKAGPDAPLSPGFWGYDGSLGARPNPGKHRASRRSSQGSLIFDVVYSIADDHFRITPKSGQDTPKSGQENSGQKKPTVFFLGCSMMFGEGLSDHETLPFFFGQLNPESVVKNYGVPGFGISQILVTLDQHVQDAGALVVVQTAPMHAHRSACIPTWTKGAPRFTLDENGELVREGVCDPVLRKAENVYILRRSYLYRKLVVPLLRRVLSSRKSVLDLYLAVLREMKRKTESRDQRLLLAFIRTQEVDAARLGESNDRILELIRGMGIDVVDVTLSPTIESLPVEYVLHPEDPHPSAAANRRRAEVLSDHLRSVEH